MINLTPIAKPIQERMFEKMKVLGREKKYIGKHSELDELQLQDMATRTTFIRMVSGLENPVIMMGGELSDDKKMMTGFADIYGPKTYGKTDTGPLGEKIKLSSKNQYYYKEQGSGKAVVVDNPNITTKHPNTFKRPIPGIKSIDVQFKGGVRALRTANISWTCWTFEDLDRLRTHFLSHGKTVALEWGWVYNKKQFNDVMSTHSLITEKGKLKEGAFSDHRKRIFDSKGDFDFMVGVVKNFEYTSRDDGGFDCKTDIVSTGVNLFDMDSSQGSSSDKMKLFDIKESDTIDEKIKKLQEFHDDPNELLNVYYNNNLSFSLFLQQFNNWISTTYDLYKGPNQLYPPADNYIVEKDKFIATSNHYYDVEKKYSVPNDVWVRWGWFEDNILSKFVTFLSFPSATADSVLINEFRSIEPILDADGKPTNKFESTKIRNHKSLQTTNYKKFILPGQFKPLDSGFLEKAAPKKVDITLADFEIGGVSIAGDSQLVQDLATKANEFSAFANVPGHFFEYEWGYFRNILFNVKFLQEMFSFTDGTTIQTGFDNLFNAMNEDVNLWDLELTNDEHEPKRTKIVDNNTTVYNWDKTFNPYEQKTIEFDGKVTNAGVFHFPVWQNNSLVKKQSISAKLPNSMQMAAMYGANADAYTNILGTDENFSKEGTRAGALGKDSKDIYLTNTELALRYPGITLGTEFGDENKHLLYSEEGQPLNQEVDQTIINTLKQDITSEIEKLEKSRVKPVENDDTLQSSYAERLVSPETLGTEVFYDTLLGIDLNKTLTKTERDEMLNAYSSKYLSNGSLKKPFIKEVNFMISKQGKKKSADLPVLIPLELELTIDGIGGIYPGNSYHSSYVPNRYRDETIFQAFNVNHTIDGSGWSVSLTGKMRATLSGLYSHVFTEDEKIAQLEKEITGKESVDKTGGKIDVATGTMTVVPLKSTKSITDYTITVVDPPTR